MQRAEPAVRGEDAIRRGGGAPAETTGTVRGNASPGGREDPAGPGANAGKERAGGAGAPGGGKADGAGPRKLPPGQAGD